MEKSPLVHLIIVFIALTSITAGSVIAHAGDEYRALTVLWINSTPIYPSDLGEPLTALTKTSCGDAVAVVYGYRSGEPLLIIVYGLVDNPENSLRDALSCPKRLMPCLSAVGLGYVAKELNKQLMELSSKATPSPNAAGETAEKPRNYYVCNSVLLALLPILGFVTGFIAARMLGQRRLVAS